MGHSTMSMTKHYRHANVDSLTGESLHIKECVNIDGLFCF
jgi:hypothetical protein